MAHPRMASGKYAKKLVRLPVELLALLEKEAEKEHRSVTGQLVHTLEKSLTQPQQDLHPSTPAGTAS